MAWSRLNPLNTYMTGFLQLDSRNGHIMISEYDRMSDRNGDTTCVSYYGVYQNLMYLSSKKSMKKLKIKQFVSDFFACESKIET